MKNFVKILSGQKGQVVSMFTFLGLIIMLGMALTMNFLISLGQKNITNDVKSTQSYYAAESGIEDALLRLKKTPSITSLSYDFDVNNITVNVEIPSNIGISKTIISQADNNDIIRKIETICSLDNTQNINFYYGIQAGAGGLVMGSNSEVIGNVFSNGNISGSGTIDNNVVISGNGNSIEGVYVKGDVLAYSCSSATIDGNLTYVTGGLHNCAVSGTTSEQSEEISQQPLPIPESQIEDWKNAAAEGGVFPGNKSISGGQTLGPIKITGNLNLSNNTILTLTGVVYVQGNITFGNNTNVRLDGSYGSLGGVLISDGTINMGNNDVFSGSGQTGSYILLISTSTSDSAIVVSNNSTGAVFYTTAGSLRLSNNVSVTEATGYRIIMNNNSSIQYSTGIVNIYFASGPGAAWEVTSWQEK